MIAFKKGDRVRYTGKSKVRVVPDHIGALGTVKKVEDFGTVGVQWDTFSYCNHYLDNLEHEFTQIPYDPAQAGDTDDDI